MSDKSALMTTNVLNTKINEVGNKYQIQVAWWLRLFLIQNYWSWNKIPGNSKYVTTQQFNKLTTENFEQNWF